MSLSLSIVFLFAWWTRVHVERDYKRKGLIRNKAELENTRYHLFYRYNIPIWDIALMEDLDERYHMHTPRDLEEGKSVGVVRCTTCRQLLKARGEAFWVQKRTDTCN